MLELQNITGGYEDTIVLRNVELVVPDGSVVALLGPNGAGKTTLLRMASGLLSPNRGAVVLDGDDITRLKANQRARAGICHIPEGRGIFPSLSVQENLIVQSRKGDEKAAIERAAATFPILGRRLKQQAGTLSGGEQQMLAMARAYDPNAQFVLVDEASLGLAPLVIDSIFEFLATLANDGKSLLIVEQYVSRVLAIANYAYLLVHGEIVREGPPNELESDELFATYMGEGVS
ncbi:MAG: ABC transporter ATP-binding protein [Acidimicrobiia bacterium]